MQAVKKDNFKVLFIQENENKKTLKTKIMDDNKEGYFINLSKKNVDTVLAAQILCNVLVVIFYGNDMYYIGEAKYEDQYTIKLQNGVNFKYPLSKLLTECVNERLTQYLSRLSMKKLNFTNEEKIEFVQLCCQTKNFPKLYLKSTPIPSLYSNDENEIMKIQSPIIKLIPDLLKLEEALPIENLSEANSTNPHVFKRVIRQMMEVNEDFHTLRTVVTPSVNGMINVFNFVMYPNDGAFCSLPLIGRIIIPKSYPKNPPVFHLFTRTNRMNLDVFNFYAVTNNMEVSSICFDLVKPTQMIVSTWKPDFTISTVFASIMSVIVSYKVQQMGGGQKQEFVTMESLKGSYRNVEKQILNRWKELSKLPKIPIIKAARLMCNQLKFQTLKKQKDYYFNYFEETLVSNPIKLQDQSWTVQFKLNSLCPQYVLSFILTNNVNDIKGQKAETVIFRNGVTATAAKKLKNGKLNWFYHGKPLNNGDMSVNITITKKQLIFSYMDDTTNGQWVIHGDTPLTSLDKKIVGDLSTQTFNLVIYVKNKNQKVKGKFSMRKVFSNVGYIHKTSQYCQ